MVRSRFSAALYLVLVFGSGILVGVVSNRLYMTNTVAANNSPRTMAQYRAQFLAEMKSKVHADDQQLSRINSIMDDSKRKYDELHAKEKPFRDEIDHERVENIRSVLNPEQRAAYDKWRVERAKAVAAKAPAAQK